MKIVSKSIELAGRTLSLEVGRFASRTNAAVFARYGDTSVLATVVLGAEDNKKDYFPLSVDYQERLYAGGRIKGSRWVKREGRPTEAEVLSGRLIDRSVRPLFPKTFKNEVQVVVTVLSVDTDNDPDVLGVVAASAALAVSNIPWGGPISAVRVGLEDGKPVVNPQNGNRNGVELDLVVSSSQDLIPMIEAGANQVPEDLVFSALKAGFETNRTIIKLISDLAAEVGSVKIEIKVPQANPELVADVQKAAKDLVSEAVSAAVGKPILDRERVYEETKEQIVKTFEPAVQAQAKSILEDLFSVSFRKQILSGTRLDGRKPEEIRPLNISVGVLPRVHGSAVFQRGETQALTVTTLGAPSLSQSLESAEGEDTKRYMHHYFFPPYSTGETGRMGSPGRREIGHGALAERALAPVIPPESDFPYAVRVVSEIMSSNGSSSMASTCGSTMSLMDAGVPLLSPVAGISTGLIAPLDYPKKTDGYVLLTDINGGEDHFGDMDFKVAGTAKGITAIQLDVKVPGLTLDICEATFKRARVARMQIMEAMLKVLPTPHAELSPFAPKISTVQIPVEKIGELIGPGGKVIKKLMADTETTVDVRDDGFVFISGTDPVGVQKAMAWVSGLGKEIVPGEIYDGTVARMQPFGAFVNIAPGKDGLVHVSQMGTGFVSDPTQVVHEGQVVKVWVTEIDSQGRINLSMLFDEAGKPVVKAREQRAPMGGSNFAAGGQPRVGNFQAPLRRNDRGPRRRF